MVEQITEKAAKRAIARAILESLREWFEVIKELWGEENPCQIYVMSLT